MRRHPFILVLVLTPVLGTASAGLSHAAWPVNGLKLCCNDAYDQINPAIVPDGAGGAIVTWQDHSGANYDIYVQRVNAAGVPQWPAGGVVVCAATGDQTDPAIVSDGSGGAIIAWRDHRGNDYDIYAQRIDSSHQPLWTTNGVTVTADSGDQGVIRIVADGAGGAFIAWEDAVGFRAQRVNASNGQRLWGTNQEGVVLSGVFEVPATFIDSDGMGGLIAVWNAFATNSNNGDSRDVFAQRLNSSGVPQWGSGGVALNNDPDTQDPVGVVSDGNGGALVAWRVRPLFDEHWDLSYGSVPADGSATPSGGTPFRSNPGSMDAAVGVRDGSAGAIFAWSDPRANPANNTRDIYVQRLPSQWPTSNGVRLSVDGLSGSEAPSIAPDGAGGAVVAWRAFRCGNSNIYAQRVDDEGTARWTTNGVAVCSETHLQQNPTIASDGAAGAIVAWQDNRNGNFDIYAMRLNSETELQPQPPPGAPTINVNWGYGSFQVWWTGRGDIVDDGTPGRWVVYMDGDSVLGGCAHEPGVLEVVEKNNVAPCTYHDIYVRVIGQDGYRMSQSNTVSGQICCSTQCDTERSHAADGGDLGLRNYSLSLGQPRPNPAKGGTTEITWSIPQDRAGEKFQLALFDVSGRKVATVAEGKAEAGSFAAMLQPQGAAPLKSGAYFLRLQIGSSRLTRSLILGQ